MIDLIHGLGWTKLLRLWWNNYYDENVEDYYILSWHFRSKAAESMHYRSIGVIFSVVPVHATKRRTSQIGDGGVNS